MAGLTIEEFARRLGEPAEQVRAWQSAGLLGSAGLGPAAVERARLVQALLRRGIALDAIVRADVEEDLFGRYLGDAADDGPLYALEQVAIRIGMEVEVLGRLMEAAWLGDRRDLLAEADVAAFAAMKVALDAGFPEEALRQLVRVYVDALGRVADAENRLFHFYVHDRLRAEGVSRRELVAAGDASRDRLIPLIEPMVLFFHRRAWARALAEDAVLHLRADAALQGEGEPPGQIEVAIAFVDLAGFTSLTEAMGDQAAADVLDAFSGLVRDAAGRAEGRVVKQIGDAFMLVFSDARAAVACALEIERLGAAEARAAAIRTGIHCGRVLYREGDYVGTCVNVAARLVAEAGRHQILVTDAVAREAADVAGARFVPLGPRRLRGLGDEIEVVAVEARGSGSHAAERGFDPVCHMELAPDAVAARLTLAGVEYLFCSTACLQRFTAAPARYAAAARP